MDCFLASDCAPKKILDICIFTTNMNKIEGYGVKTLTVIVQSNPWHSGKMNMTTSFFSTDAGMLKGQY